MPLGFSFCSTSIKKDNSASVGNEGENSTEPKGALYGLDAIESEI